MVAISSIKTVERRESEPPLEEIADYRLSNYPAELSDRLKSLVFGTTSPAEIREILLDASTTIDSHAPIGGFYAHGYDGDLVKINHAHSLLEHRAKGLTEEGRLPEALFAASLLRLNRDKIIAPIIEQATGKKNFNLAQLAIDAMSKKV